MARLVACDSYPTQYLTKLAICVETSVSLTRDAEEAAAPITAFVIAPLVKFWIIASMNSQPGKERWGWLLGEGNARRAPLFLASGFASLACGPWVRSSVMCRSR